MKITESVFDSVITLFFREQTWLTDKKDVLSAVSDRVTKLQHENEKLSEHGYVRFAILE